MLADSVRVVGLALIQQAKAGQGWIGSWSPTIGDPSLRGWLTVAAYGVAAAACWRAAGRERRAEPARAGLELLWRILAAALVLLGFNKQLDLQSAVTELGRILAHGQGWYEQRRTVQIAFIAVVCASGALGVAYLLYLARGAHGGVRWALLGTLLLVTFIAVRAASFHRVDLFLGLRHAGVTLNFALEVGGILLILAGALRRPDPA